LAGAFNYTALKAHVQDDTLAYFMEQVIAGDLPSINAPSLEPATTETTVL